MRNQNRKASPEIRWRLSTNVKRLRQARGYTQQELANLCGLTKSYVCNVEQGAVNISLANLEALATGLGCGEEDLLRLPPDGAASRDARR
jgi:transcriptional regulator with XRE-family HTH domain